MMQNDIRPESEPGSATASSSLIQQIAATLEDAGLYVDVEVSGDEVTLSGEVDSDENRVAAVDVATAAVGSRGLSVVDALEVMEMSPDSGFDSDALPLVDEPWAAEIAGAPHDPNRSDPELDPDFTDDPGTTDPQVAAAEGVPYYPPTDPVVRPASDDETLEILGGFGPGPNLDDEDGGSAGVPGDEDLAEAVAGALRRDALTSDLEITVLVRRGVVYLRGDVPSTDDASAAEAIAGDVPGVIEIREEFRTTGGG